MAEKGAKDADGAAGEGARRNTRKGTGLRRAYDVIREQILYLELPPGASLDEGQLGKSLGISRTPVRQAFMQLSGEGLVELLPNRGARVASLDLMSVREFFEALSYAQRAASRWAAIRRTPAQLESIRFHRLAFEDCARRGDRRGMMDANLQMHVAIGEACGNSFLSQHYALLLTFALRLSCLALAYEGSSEYSRDHHIELIIREHRELERLIDEQNADEVEELAQAHVELFRRRIADYLAGDVAPAVNSGPEQR